MRHKLVMAVIIQKRNPLQLQTFHLSSLHLCIPSTQHVPARELAVSDGLNSWNSHGIFFLSFFLNSCFCALLPPPFFFFFTFCHHRILYNCVLRPLNMENAYDTFHSLCNHNFSGCHHYASHQIIYQYLMFFAVGLTCF